ncbi:MAG: RNA polymerase sigma-70 factor (ECF subfamily) [Pirellulaceae bacterium]|jgi:RNA polymerase sigma-70 factor (ECF subfamily)
MHVDESAIIRQTLDGNTNAFRQLVELHQHRLYRFVCNIVADRHTAEEIAQDSFLKAYEKLSTFDSTRASFQTWLFRIARNRSLNALCKRKPVTTEENDIPFESAPDERLERAEWKRQFDVALDQLKPEQKTVFVLAEIEEMPLREIAIIEDVPLGTVKSRLSRAKNSLRQSLTFNPID